MAKERAKQLGVTDAEYERMLAAQDGHCALCPNTPKSRRLHVDHDHRTGRVRGLLCFRCNRFMPAWVTSEWALRVAEYVSDPEAARASVDALLARGLVESHTYRASADNWRAALAGDNAGGQVDN